MSVVDLDALVARHLPPDQSLDEELVRLAQLSARQRSEVSERLVVVDEYLSGERQGNAQADEAAAKLGRSRRQFLRLVAKVREFGPVRGLAPGFRNNPRSRSRDGLFAARKTGEADEGRKFDEVDEIVRDWVRAGTGRSVSELATAVRAQCAAFDLAPPSDATLRKRIHALRAEGLEREEGSSLGADILVDQVPLNLPIVNEGQGTRLAMATFIVDTYSTMILGIGLTDEDGPGPEGVGLALVDMMGPRRSSLYEYEGTVAGRVDRITWMLPPGMASPEGLASAGDGRPFELRLFPSGTRRNGAALMRLLGDRLGPYAFAPRAERLVVETGAGTGVDLDVGRRAVAAAADAWNRNRVGRNPDAPGLQAYGRRRLRNLGLQLVQAFEPVVPPSILQTLRAAPQPVASEGPPTS